MNFKYLGAWTFAGEEKKIWSSKLRQSIKVRMLIATVASMLLYIWTITKEIKKEINGCYSRMIRIAVNSSWKQNLTSKKLCQVHPLVSEIITQTRLKLVGNFVRHKRTVACELVLHHQA